VLMHDENLYDAIFQREAAKYNKVDWLLLKAQVKQESSFNPRAVSRCGAKGLAQFMPKTWKEWEDGTPGIQPLEESGIDHAALDPMDPEHAIRAQAAYMGWLLKKFNGSIDEALAAYNWGPTALQKLIAEKPGIGRAGLPVETQNYIAKIRRYYDEFRLAARADQARV
jgi:soluble lytic murein transglycosylase-like protein